MIGKELASKISASPVLKAIDSAASKVAILPYGKVLPPFCIGTLARAYDEKSVDFLLQNCKQLNSEAGIREAMIKLAHTGAKADDTTVVTAIVSKP